VLNNPAVGQAGNAGNAICGIARDGTLTDETGAGISSL